MCGYCCGNTPMEKRGDGHKGCSPLCYNAPPRAALPSEPVPTVDAEVDDLRAEVEHLNECAVADRAEAIRVIATAVARAEAAEKALADQREELATAIEALRNTNVRGVLAYDRHARQIFDQAATIVRTHGAGA